MSGARTWLAAAVVTVAAFLLYDATLLPGQDLGDTASFEATAGSRYITPRQAYPLYYATTNPFVWALPVEPARAANVASAVFGAVACGLLSLAVSRLTARAAAGIVAGLLLGSSYTFWSQAIIAEVYALHACMMALCFLAVLRWTERPTLGPLAVFFGIYALGFGNHLMMILLLPGFATYLLLAAPGGPSWLLRPRVLALAVLMAALGASQYLWNLSYLLAEPGRPGLVETIRTFWFEVTKADWRATMVMGVQESGLPDRAAMWWFDLRQQFGLAGVGLTLAGLTWSLLPGQLPGALSRLPRWRAGVSLVVLFLGCWFFAFTYNVGDAHVFFIPAHVITALFAGLGTAAVLSAGRTAGQALLRSERGAHLLTGVVAVLLVALPAWRAYDAYPALDRSSDWQVKEFFDALTRGLTGNNSVFAADLNWQLHNGLDYYAEYTKPDLAVADTTEALLYFPFIVQSNREMGRPVALTRGARKMVKEAYGPLFEVQQDTRVPAAPLAERVARFPRGTPFVLTVLAPYPDIPLDPQDLSATLAWLTGARDVPSARYNVIVGRAGEKPLLVHSENRPFRLSTIVAGRRVDVRIECWLPADTIRRMGFGRVVVERRPVLTLDRGVSIVALNPDGTVKGVEYGWTILAPQPRWIVPVESPSSSTSPRSPLPLETDSGIVEK
jgi:hypothetical protein